MAALEQEVADLKAQWQRWRQRTRRIGADLRAKLQQARERGQRNSSNSSLPPSANPPDAPRPTPKQPSGRKPGGQPGHPPYPRQRVPAARLTQVMPFIPETCGHCQTPLPAQPGANDPEPAWWARAKKQSQL